MLQCGLCYMTFGRLIGVFQILRDLCAYMNGKLFYFIFGQNHMNQALTVESLSLTNQHLSWTSETCPDLRHKLKTIREKESDVHREFPRGQPLKRLRSLKEDLKFGDKSLYSMPKRIYGLREYLFHQLDYFQAKLLSVSFTMNKVEMTRQRALLHNKRSSKLMTLHNSSKLM